MTITVCKSYADEHKKLVGIIYFRFNLLLVKSYLTEYSLHKSIQVNEKKSYQDQQNHHHKSENEVTSRME